MSNGNAVYTFLPWARRGLSAALSTPDPGFPNLPGSTATIAIDFHVNLDTVHVDARLYGPPSTSLGSTYHQVVLAPTRRRPGAVDFRTGWRRSAAYSSRSPGRVTTPTTLAAAAHRAASGSSGDPAAQPLGRVLEPDMALVLFDHEIHGRGCR